MMRAALFFLSLLPLLVQKTFASSSNPGQQYTYIALKLKSGTSAVHSSNVKETLYFSVEDYLTQSAFREVAVVVCVLVP